MVKRELPDGHVQHYEGEKDRERVVKVELPNGQVEHFEGEKGAERLVRTDFLDGAAATASLGQTSAKPRPHAGHSRHSRPQFLGICGVCELTSASRRASV